MLNGKAFMKWLQYLTKFIVTALLHVIYIGMPFIHHSQTSAHITKLPCMSPGDLVSMPKQDSERGVPFISLFLK